MFTFLAIFFWFSLFIVLFFLLVGLWLLSRLRQFLSGGGRQFRSRSTNHSSKASQNQPTPKKIFADNEGEYVDFEEVPQEGSDKQA